MLFNAPLAVFFGGWYAKLLAVALFSLMFGIYMKIEKIPRLARSRREISDIFNDLTFRERYHALLATSGVDGLTGALDRNRLEADAPGLLRASLSMGDTVSLIIIDADRFKEVNDLFGHLKGDDVLKGLAASLRAGSRPRDRLFRFGGEEFVMILPQTDHDGALALAEHLRLATRYVQRPDGQGMTVSIGVATAPDDGTALEVLLAVADARLYQAKKDGRDNVHGRSGRLGGAAIAAP
jgi:diguanylate cyclase (GGDEF)-like protein